MKNLTNKRGFFAVAAALLILTAMLVTKGCSNDIISGEFIPPEGKGAVRLSFNDNVTRTILPGTAIDIDSFDEFDFTFTATGSTSTSSSLTKTVAKSVKNDPIVLDPGTYDLTVIGKINNGGTPEPVASNALPVPVTIAAGKIVKAVVVLRLNIDTSGVQGTFTYTINSPDLETGDITTATMSIIPLTTNGSTDYTGVNAINITSLAENNPLTDSLILNTGIYRVEFYLEVGADKVTFMNILHIYEGETSSYTFSIGLTYFNAVFQGNNITFEENTPPVISYVITPVSTGIPDLPVDYTSGTSFNINRGDSITFTVKNASLYSGIEWYCVGNTALPGSYTDYCTVVANAISKVYTCNIITTPNADNPFSVARDYNLTVVGADGAHKYSTIVKFAVKP